MTVRTSTSVIRHWARAQGLTVSDQGRLSPQVLDAYATSHDQIEQSAAPRPAHEGHACQPGRRTPDRGAPHPGSHREHAHDLGRRWVLTCIPVTPGNRRYLLNDRDLRADTLVVVELWLMLGALGVTLALVLREWRRWGWVCVSEAAAAWGLLAGVGVVRSAITEMPPADFFLGAALLYSVVCIISGGRPILVMTGALGGGKDEEFTRNELRRGLATRVLLVAAICIAGVYREQ